jgi:hypothetical protein
MRTADLLRSDVGFAGLTLRCSNTGFEALVVLLNPLPPRSRPKVKLAAGSTPIDVTASIVPPGAALVLPNEVATLVSGPWQSAAELAVTVEENGATITRGVVSLTGLASALALLVTNCPSR